MQLFVRCLLWILMAALPLQGSAAVFASCKLQAPVAGGHAHPCHDQGAVPGGGQQHAMGDLKAHGKCSTCASCCTAAAAPPLSFGLPSPCPRPVRAQAPPEAAIAAVFPGVPERPPRDVS